MAETYFDTYTQGLFMAVPGAPPLSDAATNTTVPLVRLLNSKQFPFTADSYEKLDSKHWTPEHFIEFGKWVLTVLAEESDEDPELKRYHIARLSVLGIGPSRNAYKRAGFPDLETYRAAINAKPGYARGNFDNWSDADFAHMASKIEAEVGGKPKYEDYVAFGKKSEYPGIVVIEKRYGKISRVNEFLGYPNCLEWTRQDFITYGLRIIEVNGPDALTLATVRIIGSRDRGASERAILNRFDTWSNFKQAVEEQSATYLSEIEAERNSRAVMAAYYRNKLEQGLIPSDFSTLDDDSFLQICACYHLATVWLPDTLEDVRQRIAELKGSYKFTELLIRSRPGTTKETLTEKARTIGIDTLIWPRDTSYRRYLHVSKEDIADIYRRKHRTKTNKSNEDKIAS